MRKFVYSNQI